jgi:hypothetical protein
MIEVFKEKFLQKVKKMCENSRYYMKNAKIIGDIKPPINFMKMCSVLR